MEGMDGLDSVRTYECSGTVWMDPLGNKQGTYVGHVLAGTALLIWAAHWNFGIYHAWLTQTKARLYHYQPTWRVWPLPESWPVEAVLKVLVPLAAILANVIGPNGLRRNTCGEHEPRGGHFDPQVVFYFGNIWSLVPFLLSGLVDLLALAVELPNGTQNVFTATGFLMQAFLVSMAQKGNMLADNSYYLLFMMSMATAVCLLLEVAFPTSLFVSCGRTYSTYMQAVWFFNLAAMLYGGSPMWDPVSPLPDMAPAMFVPVPFVFWLNATSLFMFIVYAGMAWAIGTPPDDVVALAAGPVAPPGYAPPGYAPGFGRANGKHVFSEMVPLVARH